MHLKHPLAKGAIFPKDRETGPNTDDRLLMLAVFIKLTAVESLFRGFYIDWTAFGVTKKEKLITKLYNFFPLLILVHFEIYLRLVVLRRLILNLQKYAGIPCVISNASRSRWPAYTGPLCALP